MGGRETVIEATERERERERDSVYAQGYIGGHIGGHIRAYYATESTSIIPLIPQHNECRGELVFKHH